jgi:hypothetical protein
VLRYEGLLVAAPTAETQPVQSGDWAAWKKALLAQTRKVIEVSSKALDEMAFETAPVPEHKEHKKTMSKSPQHL